MYTFLLQAYEKMLRDARGTATRAVYENVIDTLRTSYDELVKTQEEQQAQENAVKRTRLIVETWQASTIQWYHEATTDYGKQRSGLYLDLYGFFLHLSNPTIPELPYK